jgi:hypothetical protein
VPQKLKDKHNRLSNKLNKRPSKLVATKTRQLADHKAPLKPLILLLLVFWAQNLHLLHHCPALKVLLVLRQLSPQLPKSPPQSRKLKLRRIDFKKLQPERLQHKQH